MARPIDEFSAAWAALSEGSSDESGWRGIPVSPAGPCLLLAARQFPGDEESLLVRFSSASMLASELLPEGKGFEVVKVDPHRDGKAWLAISRRDSGNFELFAELVGDVVGAMDAAFPGGEDEVLHAMLRRVRLWQHFMGKGAVPLGPEAEIGLVGELTFLSLLIDQGLDSGSVVGSWVGPEDAPQDFVLGVGAVEVKATVASSGFQARIGSLEQLDDSILSPLFLAGIRLSIAPSGRNLPEIIETVEGRLASHPAALQTFGDKLFAAGYTSAHASKFHRRFAREEVRIYQVATDFPRLIPSSVPEGVTKAVYSLELSRASAFEVDASSALKKLGVTT